MFLVSTHSNNLRPIPKRHSSLQHLGEVGSSPAGNGVPSLGRIPARIRDNGATVGLAVEPGQTITARATTLLDVVQHKWTDGVHPRVQESHGRKLGLETSVVEQCHDGSEGRSRSRRALEMTQSALVVHSVANTLGSDIGEATAIAVEVGLELVSELSEVAFNGDGLPDGAGPVVGEAARGEKRRFLIEELSSAYGGDPGA